MWEKFSQKNSWHRRRNSRHFPTRVYDGKKYFLQNLFMNYPIKGEEFFFFFILLSSCPLSSKFCVVKLVITLWRYVITFHAGLTFHNLFIIFILLFIKKQSVRICIYENFSGRFALNFIKWHVYCIIFLALSPISSFYVFSSLSFITDLLLLLKVPAKERGLARNNNMSFHTYLLMYQVS